jgi:predicted nucleotidyltransferase
VESAAPTVRTKRAGQSALLLLDAVEVLQREKVDYAVIGAFALSAHGVVRASIDVDVLLFTTPQHLTRLRTRFQRAGLETKLRRGEADDPIPTMLTLSDVYHNHVDLLGVLRGVDPAIFSRTVAVPFRGVNLRIVGREDFIAMKCFAGSPQDVRTPPSSRLAVSPLHRVITQRKSIAGSTGAVSQTFIWARQMSASRGVAGLCRRL